MKVLFRLLLAIALTSCVKAGPPPTEVADPRMIAPNVWFEVEAEAGNCPATVGLWDFLLGFEGGADHTVIADTAAITTLPVEIIQAEDRRIVYEAPLQEEFAACVGTARSEQLAMYSFEFAQGQVRFTLDMTDDQGFRQIRYADVSSQRPYIYWRAAE
jgi:hypothetical protein